MVSSSLLTQRNASLPAAFKTTSQPLRLSPQQRTDMFSAVQRSWIMRQVHSQHTKPELLVRSLVHRLGYRFRLYKRDLPGAPDLVFSSRAKVIFVHGCFWHGHPCRRGARMPKANADYWRQKIARNKQRDQRHRRQLRRLGWDVLVLWECQLRDQKKLAARLVRFLAQPLQYSYNNKP
ncbi:MAG TPA: very short patch repair endonuclease [Methylomirabilota bacterium]|jgi:DNA mismatch endonuclease (patch repair protein)|nr:very short patch repair endonuclease [Methylomirabilota bacterium]